jgi:NADPH-ferrihemoprotein reductase
MLAKEAKDRAWESSVIDMDEYDPENLSNEKLVVFVASCFGRGEPTDNARKMFNWLMAKDANNKPLRGVKYAVFGLGSSAYDCDRFQAVGRAIDKKMQDLGAEQVCPRGEGDDANDIDEDWEKWAPTLWDHLSTKFMTEGDQVAHTTSASEAKDADPHVIFKTTEEKSPSKVAYYKQFNEKIFDIKNPYVSRVDLCEELHTPLSGRSCKHIAFDIKNTNITYHAGDYLGVFPKNERPLVAAAAEYLKKDLDAEFSLTQAGLDELLPKIPHTFPNPCTVREALTEYCDLTSPPRKSFLRAMAELADDPREKESLNYLATLDFATKREEIERSLYYKNLLELLRQFPSVKMSFDKLLELTPALQCRYYSISSSSLVVPDHVEITCVRHMFTSPYDSKAMRGLCSNYLTNLHVGEQVKMFVKPSLFKLPDDPMRPIVMFAAGTGLAPFRGFMQERAFVYKKIGKVGKNLLFFGCFDRKKDFIYANELKQWQDMGILDLVTAFSHEQEERIFVQHRMKQHSAEIWRLISKENAIVYICGSKPMGDGVNMTIAQIITQEGGLSNDQTREYIANMINEHLYQVDVFD